MVMCPAEAAREAQAETIFNAKRRRIRSRPYASCLTPALPFSLFLAHSVALFAGLRHRRCLLSLLPSRIRILQRNMNFNTKQQEENKLVQRRRRRRRRHQGLPQEAQGSRGGGRGGV